MSGQILDEHELQQLKASYMSDNTAYMKWSTELEPKKDVMDGEFMNRNRNLILFADKFAPLANFTEPRLMQLHKLKQLNMILAQSAGLDSTAEETVISAIDDIQVSRGDHGFYQRALITQRHELQQEEHSDTQKKVGFFNKLFSKKEPPQQGVQQQ